MTDDTAIAAAPHAEAAAESFPKILPSIGWIALYFALQAICTSVAIAMLLGVDKLGDPAALYDNPSVILWGIASSAAIQLLLIAIYLRRQDRMERIGLTHFGQMKLARVVGLAFILVMAAMVFNAFYSNFIIPGIKMQGDYAAILAKLEMNAVNVALGIFVVVIAAPLVEELLFRGFLQRAIANRLPVWAAILISSFAFSLVHGQYYAIPALMSLSIAFGYLYHLTGSLRTNILLHMANNAATLLLLSQRVT